jgi:hypothetical protein
MELNTPGLALSTSVDAGCNTIFWTTLTVVNPPPGSLLGGSWGPQRSSSKLAVVNGCAGAKFWTAHKVPLWGTARAAAMTAVGQKHVLPHRNIAVCFTSINRHNR